ncbi:MAG: class I adenylate-forming enzyme family protein [Bradymonadia bacterium]
MGAVITGYGDWVQKWAEVAPWRVAIRETRSGQALHYGELSARSWRWAHTLGALGVEAGDRVAILAKNAPSSFELLVACLRRGAAYTPLNWRLAVPELGDILGHCTPKVLVYDDHFAEAAGALFEAMPEMKGIALGHAVGDHQTYARLLTEASDTVARVTHPEETVGMLLYTSGTTGRPKGVMLPHKQLFYNAINTVYATDMGPDDRVVACLPLFHTGGLNCLATPALYRGGTMLLSDAFDPEQILQISEAQRATVMVGVPTMYHMLLESGLDRYDLSSMHTLLCGGAPLPDVLLDAWLDRGFNFRQGFGMTEVGPNCFSLPPWMVGRKRGSVGQPVIHGGARVDAPVGEVGELLLGGPIVCAGYWQDPENTAKAIKDGWFHTGDLARVDEGGFFYIAGRQKDMFISGGENVYPAEVENAILEHPQVDEAVVIGVPDARWGEVGLAVVVPVAGSGFDPGTLKSHCSEHLARFKVPKYFKVADTLPKNTSGKVIKAEVKSLYGDV